MREACPNCCQLLLEKPPSDNSPSGLHVAGDTVESKAGILHTNSRFSCAYMFVPMISCTGVLDTEVLLQ